MIFFFCANFFFGCGNSDSLCAFFKVRLDPISVPLYSYFVVWATLNVPIVPRDTAKAGRHTSH